MKVGPCVRPAPMVVSEPQTIWSSGPEINADLESCRPEEGAAGPAVADLKQSSRIREFCNDSGLVNSGLVK